ncbi:MAG: leader peptidase (prepilin peptidase)/N-methyltransferase [Candidatus Azotimanducaceae bacterium]|jgi:leader peptidase (prepilin peptidase)/N-methyltransferase
MAYLDLIEAEFPLLLLSISLIFGLLIGSFLNVVIHRIPIMLEREWNAQAKEILEIENDTEVKTEVYNLVFPNSHCPKCKHKIRAWENIPLLSYSMLGGKCASCKTKISIRYPSVELLTGILTAIIIMTFGPNLSGLMACALTWSLISLSLIDYDHKLLPDDITLPVLWLGLICNYFELFASFSNAFWGAIIGYLSLWTVYQVFKLVTGKEGMGFGDFKLLALLGAWMGWQMLPLIIILSSLTGAIIGGALIALGRDKTNAIPFGPFLAVAGWIAFIWGQEITIAYLKLTAF